MGRCDVPRPWGRREPEPAQERVTHRHTRTLCNLTDSPSSYPRGKGFAPQSSEGADTPVPASQALRLLVGAADAVLHSVLS